jgi:hypothetical protein
MPVTKRETRQNEQRSQEYVYKPAAQLDFPEGFVEHFLNSDPSYSLRWIRHTIDNNDDAMNLTQKIREGWEIVDIKSIPPEFKDWFTTQKVRTQNQAICVGDLVLAKMLTEKVKARSKYYEGLSQQRVQDARSQAKKTDDSRMHTMAPVTDESKSEVEIS